MFYSNLSSKQLISHVKVGLCIGWHMRKKVTSPGAKQLSPSQILLRAQSQLNRAEGVRKVGQWIFHNGEVLVRHGGRWRSASHLQVS